VKVLVLGAGVVGTACAHYLAKDGHQVTVIDRQPAAGLETSFGNAGGVCPGFAGPWAAPGMPIKALKWMGQRDAPLVLRPTLDLHQWTWLAKFLVNCSVERYTRNKSCMQRIAQYSKACLVALRAETGITYDHGTGGVLQVFRTEDEVAGGRRSAAVLENFGVAHRLVDRDEVLAIEPSLRHSPVRFAGGLHLPDDETGDCHLFTAALSQRLTDAGVIFAFDTNIRALRTENGRVRAVVTDKGDYEADAYVVALASATPMLLRPIGIRVPIYPVKGYALTAEVTCDDDAPRSSVMDEHYKIMVTRLGSRIRAAGMAEVGGYDLAIRDNGRATIAKILRELFPRGLDHSAVTAWSGLRPMTPDGPPHLGRSRYDNLYLNVGQGSNGWTQACGCGRIIADLVAHRTPEIALDGFTPGR
jgi:D-amino-acid dehydrogenase